MFSAPDPPDYTPLANAQKKLGRRQLDLMEKTATWAERRARRLDNITDEAVRRVFKQSRVSNQRANQAYRDYLKYYRPEQIKQFQQDAKRSDKAYRQSQEDRRRALKEYDRQLKYSQQDRRWAEQDYKRQRQYTQEDRRRALKEYDRQLKYSQNDRRYYENVARPLQRELIRQEQDRMLQADKDRSNIIAGTLGEADRLSAQAQEDRATYMKEYRPYEQQFAQELRNFNTPGRENFEAARAVSQVGQAFAAQRANAERRLSDLGVDPSMMRAGAIDRTARIGEAVAKAQADTMARQYVDQEGVRRGAMAVDIGRGIQDMSMQASGQSLAGYGTAGQQIYGQGQVGADGLTSGGSGYGGALLAAGNLAAGLNPASGVGGSGGYGGLNSAAAQIAATSGYSGLNPAAVGTAQQQLVSSYAGQGNQLIGQAPSAGANTLAANSQAMSVPVAYGEGASRSYMGAAETMNLGYQNQLQQAQANYAMGPGALLSSFTTLGGALLGGFFEEGGPVEPEMSPSRGRKTDDVLAAVNVGEYVVDRDTVSWFGEKHFEKLKQKAIEERQGGGAVPTRASTR